MRLARPSVALQQFDQKHPSARLTNFLRCWVMIEHEPIQKKAQSMTTRSPPKAERTPVGVRFILLASILLIGACAHQPASKAPIEQLSIDDGALLSLEQTAQWAQIDYANSQEIDLDDVIIVEAREVIWSSGALGCPREGGFYTQALVDGHLIVLGHNNRRISYHAQRGKIPFLCPEERRERPIDVGQSIY